MFDVIPAIDVHGGRVATFGPTGPERIDAFAGDPLAAAAAAVAAGAGRIHVVDMDLAFEGVARNLDVVAAIAELGVRVQAAGGVRTVDEVRAFLGAGASRVVLGSGALGDEAATAAVISRERSHLLVGIEVDGGRIRSRGRAPVDLGLMETVGWLVAAGAGGFLVTSVGRVAGRRGPDVELVHRLVRAGRPVLAAGGVATLADLRDLRAAGASGAVVGRAALDGSLDLAAAIGEFS